MIEHKNQRRAPWRPLTPATLMLSTGGLGFLRPAPGTWGSLPPVLLIAALALAGAGPETLQAVAFGCLAVFSVICVVLGDYAERRFAVKDAPEVVADETAGVALPVLAATFLSSSTTTLLASLVLAFSLFRLFDIAKPWPVKRLEALRGGWGVLMDDLMAGVYAAVGVVILARIFF